MKTRLLMLSGIAWYGALGAIQTWAQGGIWTTKAPMSTARQSLGVGVLNGLLYAVGGNDSSGWPFPAVEAYDPVSDTWSDKPLLPTARGRLAVGVAKGILYAIGGCTDNGCGFTTSDIVEAYDPVADTWTTKASMPTRRRDFAVGVINDMVYAVGGWDWWQERTGALEAYDPLANTWTSLAPMPTPRSTLAVAVVDGILYAIGGDSVGTVEAYNPTSNTWTARSPLPVPRDSLAAGVIGGRVYVVGGNSNLGIQADVAAYDPITDTWTTNAPMPTARFALGAGVVNGVLYALGGQGTMKTNEAFTPCSLSLNMYAGLTMVGHVGTAFRIDYCSDLITADWIALTNLALPSSPYLFIDVSSPGSARRYYRAVPLQ